jgi:hypothetical protein
VRTSPPGGRPPAFVGQIASTLLVVLTSAVLLRTLDMRELGPGPLFGLVVGIGYLAAMVLNIAINPFRYSLLNVPYFLVCSLLTSTIITLLA